MRRQGGLFLVVFFWFVAQAPGQPAGSWEAGAASVDITPTEPIWLAGYAARTKPSDGVVHPIHAKALFLQDPGGNRLVVVTSDILGFTAGLSEPIAQQLEKKFKLRRDQVLLTSSHTHSAPVVREYMVFAYGLSAEQEAAIERYSKQLEAKVVEVVGAAMKNRAAATLSFGRGRANFGINRRTLGQRGMAIGVNPTGPVDPEVPVLRVSGRDGALRALLFGYACHNTTLGGDFYQVNGDYAGFAEAALEKSHPGTTALFVAGFAGDTNPNPRGKLEHAQQYGNDLAAAVDQVLKGSMTPVNGALGTSFDRVRLRFATPPTKAELEARLLETETGRQRHARRMLDTLARDGRLPEDYPCPVQAARFGNSFLLIALGGEVVVDYSIRLRREITQVPLFLIAYANDVFAYVPSLRILKEGGYEGGGSMIFYGRPAPWAEDVEETLVKKIHEVVGAVRPEAK